MDWRKGELYDCYFSHSLQSSSVALELRAVVVRHAKTVVLQ